jgi:AcrR family transcriptional regulator
MARESKREHRQAEQDDTPRPAREHRQAEQDDTPRPAREHRQAEQDDTPRPARDHRQAEQDDTPRPAREHRQAERGTRRPARARKQEGRGNTQERTGKREQAERGNTQEPTRERRQGARATTREPTPEQAQVERAATRERTREYKQVERAKARERTREALIEAATAVFFEGNWLKTSLDSLSRTAGVTRQTLLRHFGSKEGLLLQSVMHGVAQALNQRWSTPTTDIAGVVDNLLDHYEEWGERSVHLGSWQRGPSVLAPFSNAARQIHHDWVEHVFSYWLDPFDKQARARRRAALIVLCDVQTWWILSNDLGLPRKEVRAILTDLIERALARDE